jgi:hypothetical protein
MQIYLPDVAPVINNHEEEIADEEDVKIVRLESCAEDDDEEVHVGEPDDSADMPPGEGWPEEIAPPERGSVIVLKKECSSSSLQPAGQPSVGELENILRDHRQAGQEEEGEMQILETFHFRGQHGGVQKITFVAENGGAVRGTVIGGQVITDQICQLLESWNGVPPPALQEIQITGVGDEASTPTGNLLKLLEFQVGTNSLAADGPTPPLPVLVDDIKMKEHNRQQQQQPQRQSPSKAAVLAASSSYTKKLISRSVKHGDGGRVSTGTQASSWTKMAAERVKVARSKLITPRDLSASADIEGGGHVGGSPADLLLARTQISTLHTWDSQQRRSIGTQVLYNWPVDGRQSTEFSALP